MDFFYGNPFFLLFLLANFGLINSAEKQPNSPPPSNVPLPIPTNSTEFPIPNQDSTKMPHRILILYAPDAPSHLVAMKPMINRLASAGHQVYILCITSQEKTEKYAENVHEIRVKIAGDFDRKKAIAEMANIIWNYTLHSPLMPLIYSKFSQAYDDLLKDHSDQLAEVINSKWDLIILDELFTIHGFMLAQLFHKNRGILYVIYCTSIMMNTWANANGQSWVTHPSAAVPTPSNANDGFVPSKFTHRLFNVAEKFGEIIALEFVDNFQISPRLAKITGKNDFSFSKFYAESEMSMISSIAHLALPQTEMTEVLHAGANCEEANELPEEYRTFVEDPKSKGTIYVAFGTIVPWDYAPPHVVKAFFDAFERLSDYRIIFSFNGKFPDRKLSSHIRLVKWAPQLAILTHSKTKIFLTHCGLKSIKESLCSKTPMLAMPVFAEQNHNARLVIEMGIGIALNKYNVVADELHSNLLELLNNAKYSERVEKLQKIFLDRPIDELDYGEFYIRRIMEKKDKRMGKFFFKRKGIQLNWIEYFYIDLTIAFIAFILFVSSK